MRSVLAGIPSISFARTMSKEELREAYVELMIELDEYRSKV